MTELTIRLMAALADKRKIRNLDAALKRRCGEREYTPTLSRRICERITPTT